MNSDSQLQSNVLEEPQSRAGVERAPNEGTPPLRVVGADLPHRVSASISPNHTPPRKILTLKGLRESGRTGQT